MVGTTQKYHFFFDAAPNWTDSNIVHSKQAMFSCLISFILWVMNRLTVDLNPDYPAGRGWVKRCLASIEVGME